MCSHVLFLTWISDPLPPPPPPLTPPPPPTPNWPTTLCRWICMCVFTCAFSNFLISDPPPPPYPLTPIPPLIFLGQLPFLDESAWVHQSWCQSGQPFGHISQAWVFYHINRSKCPLGSRGGNYFLAHVRSQMNPHMCAKFGANRSSRLADFTYFSISDPLKPPMCPLGHTGQIFILPTTFSRWICLCVPNLVPIGPQTAT